MITRTLDLAVPLHLERTISPLLQGLAWSPAARRLDQGLAWALRTPQGDVTLQLHVDPTAARLHATAWGEGADWALEHVDDLLGLHDPAEAFQPEHPLLRKLALEMAGVRLPRVPNITEALVRIVLSQKVTNKEARRSDHELSRRYGRPAPGPHDLRLPPTGPELGRLSLDDLRDAGVLTQQARTLQYLGRRSAKVDELATLEEPARLARLDALRGIGPWSAASLRLHALGDADAVVVGDAHLHDDVTHALSGEERGSDERMLELLAPYAGHRGRVVLWLVLGGHHAPRFGPKRTPRATRRQIAQRRGGRG